MDGMEELLDKIADAVAEKVVQRMQEQKATYTVEDLIKRYGKSRSTINRLIAAGAFGETIRLGERSRVVTEEGLRQFEQANTGTGREGKTAPPVRRRRHTDPGPI